MGDDDIRFVLYLENVLSTDQKGAIAELAIALRAVELGIDVYRPMAEGGRYDLIFDLGQRLLRVQCKWATKHAAVVLVRCRRCRRTRDGILHRGYEQHEIDGVAAYCAELDRCFFLPVDQIAGRKAIHLRLGPARNNQSQLVNWADDFRLESLQSKVLVGP